MEEFRICGATAFTDFLSDEGEELLCPLEYGVAAGITRTGIAQQGFESFHCRPTDEPLVSPPRGVGLLGMRKFHGLGSVFENPK
jgi:hypothetical protein